MNALRKARTWAPKGYRKVFVKKINIPAAKDFVGADNVNLYKWVKKK